jgi:hypothetical protein
MEQIVTNVLKPQVNFTNLGVEYKDIDTDSESNLDSKIREVRDFTINNHGEGKSSQEKDNLYLESHKLWKNFINELNEVKYNFYLNKDQWTFLTELVLEKLEYDINSVFFAIELKELFEALKEMKYKGDEMISYPVNATEVTYIYHLISKHTVKGLTKDSYLFSEVLLLIGNISKIFNYYDTTGKNLSTDIQDWVLTFEDGVNFSSKQELVEKK